MVYSSKEIRERIARRNKDMVDTDKYGFIHAECTRRSINHDKSFSFVIDGNIERVMWMCGEIINYIAKKQGLSFEKTCEACKAMFDIYHMEK